METAKINKRLGRLKIVSILIAFFLVGITLFTVYFLSNSTVNVVVSKGSLDELTMDQKLKDFDFAYKVLSENYPYFNVEKRKIGYDWLSHKNEFEEWIKATRNNREFYSTMEKILSLVQSGHTNLLSPNIYNEYRQIYTGIFNKPWRDVLNNNGSVEKYKLWSGIVENGTGVIPVNFAYIEGRYIAVESSAFNGFLEKYNIPEYSILERVNGINIDDYLKKLMDERLILYDFKRDKLKVKSLIIPCSENETMKLTFKTTDGKNIKRNIDGISYDYKTATVKGSDRLYDTCILKENNTAYLKVSSFSAFYVDKDKEGILEFLKSIRDYPYLIIDIRGNGGGSENYWIQNIVQPLVNNKLEAHFYFAIRAGDYIKPFINARGISIKPINNLPENLNYPSELFSNFYGYASVNKKVSPKKEVGFHGKIFLLVDDYVYSSAESFAAFTKATNWATIVGTETGGDGIGIDPALFVLPESGLIVRFPLEMGINPDGTANEETHTKPDIYCEETLEDFIKYQKYEEKNSDALINPYDTILNKALELEK